MKAFAFKTGNTGYVFHGVTVEDTARTILLLEKYAGKQYQLPKGYYLRYDTAHIPDCKDHFHLDRRGRSLGAFNMDGSSHDNSNFRIPRVVADFSRQHFPHVNIPSDRYIRASILKEAASLLLQECIKNGTKFELLLVIDLDEVEVVEPYDDQIKLLKDLLDYLN